MHPAIEEFETIVEYSIQRDGIDNLMQWIRNTDFYTAPASTKYHGSSEHGLVFHSLSVYRNLKNLVESGLFGDLKVDYSDETIAIVSLFHDVCKIGCYKIEPRWRKDANNKWEQYNTYTFNEDFCFGGHGSKSVYLIHNFMSLTPEEAVSINCHMGQWDSTTYSNPVSVYEQVPLAWLLHVADEASSFIDKL